MHSLTKLAFREQIESLIRQLGYKEGYLPTGWYPVTADEKRVEERINWLAKQLDDN